LSEPANRSDVPQRAGGEASTVRSDGRDVVVVGASAGGAGAPARYEKLVAERDRYRELFQLAPDAYLVTDRSAVIVEANDAAALLLGVRPQHLVGKPLAEFVTLSERQTFRARVLRAGRNGRVEEWECRLQPRTGPEVDVAAKVNASQIPGHDDRVRCLLRDVSERTRAELEIRTSNAELEWRVVDRTAGLEAANRQNELLLAREKRARRHLADVLDRLRHGVIVVDRRLRVDFANDAGKRLLAPARLIEREELPEAWPEWSLQSFAARLFERDEVGSSLVERRSAGALKTYAVSGVPAGGASTAVLIVADVSERERRERAQRDFISNAAHELQTPLTAIASAIDVLQLGAKELPEQRNRFLAHIERETARLTRLTRGLLILARAQALGEVPQAEQLQLCDILQAVADGIARGNGVSTKVECPGELTVGTSRELLEQALGELASNAAKYGDGSPVVFAARPAEDGRVVIEVRDSGAGISAAERERVFDRFYRADGRPGEGFGLGLSIVDQIVRAVGGELELDSRQGDGTIARVVLPARPDRDAPAPEPSV
jgi:PAS domain S-box-containing protein